MPFSAIAEPLQALGHLPSSPLLHPKSCRVLLVQQLILDVPNPAAIVLNLVFLLPLLCCSAVACVSLEWLDQLVQLVSTFFGAFLGTSSQPLCYPLRRWIRGKGGSRFVPSQEKQA